MLKQHVFLTNMWPTRDSGLTSESVEILENCRSSQDAGGHGYEPGAPAIYNLG